MTLRGVYRDKNIFAFRRVSRCSTLTGTTYYQPLCARFPFRRVFLKKFENLTNNESIICSFHSTASDYKSSTFN